MNVSVFAGEHTLLGKWFFGQGLWCQIVELPAVFYDSFFIISPLMRQIKTNPHSFPSVWGLLLAFLSCCSAEVPGFEKSRLAASSLFVAALAEMGCHLGTMAAETQQTKAVPGCRGWRVKSSLAPQHCLRSNWAAIYPWSPKAREGAAAENSSQRARAQNNLGWAWPRGCVCLLLPFGCGCPTLLIHPFIITSSLSPSFLPSCFPPSLPSFFLSLLSFILSLVEQLIDVKS